MIRSHKRMSKIHNKTGRVCLVCDDETDLTAICMHRTRRQTHNLCLECAIGYLTPILESITRNLRQNIRYNVQYVDCPGSYHGAMRNRCKHKVDVCNIVLPPRCSLADDLFRITYVLSSNNAFICPETKCGAVIDVDPHFDDLKLRCRECRSTWCRQCAAHPYHDRKSCIEFEVENKASDNAQYIYEMSKKGLIKFCPQCKAATLKTTGCNKMRCQRCKCKWCWLCLQSGIDYDHFNKGNKDGCPDKLWQGTDTNAPVPLEDGDPAPVVVRHNIIHGR
jgi:hypothetical protein